MMPFGAFADLGDGIDGLIYISQIANKRIAKPDDVLKIGQIVDVKVIEIDVENKKIALSIKEVRPIDADEEIEEEKVEEKKKESITEKLNDDKEQKKKKLRKSQQNILKKQKIL